MDAFSMIVSRLYQGIATWYMAAIIGGVSVLIVERRDRRREPSDDDVRRAASLYSTYYGAEAHRIIGDHMLGASFAPDGRHKRFLARVAFELVTRMVTTEDRALAIER